MRADEEDVYIDTVGRMSDIELTGRSDQPRAARGESGSTSTGISSTRSSCSLSPSVAVDLSSCPYPLPGRPMRVLACFADTPEDVGDVDELELAVLVELSVAAGSISDLDLSRLCFWRNLGSFEPCCGLGDDDGGGVLRGCLDIQVVCSRRKCVSTPPVSTRLPVGLVYPPLSPRSRNLSQ